MLSIGAISVAAAGIGRLTLADLYRTEARQALRSNPDRSLDLTADALALQLGDLEALYLAATAYARKGDYGSARASLLRGAELEPSNFPPRTLLGDLALRRGDLDTAAREYRRAVALNPLNADLRR